MSATAGGSGHRRVRGAYRCLLLLLPRELRRRHGTDMLETFTAAHAAAAARGRRAVLRLWGRELWDHVRTGIALRAQRAASTLSWRASGRGTATGSGTAIGSGKATGAGTATGARRAAGAGSAVGAFVDDLRLATRATVRQPGFFLLAVLTFALGIGTTTAMYSALKAVVLDPMPGVPAERLVTLWRTFGENTQARLPLETSHLEALRAETELFARLEAYSATQLTLTGHGDPRQIRALRVTPGMLEVLGTSPRLGRGFTPEEATGAGARVALLDHGFWRSNYGGRQDVVGETIHLQGEAWTVVGVLPREATQSLGGERGVDVWTPLPETASIRISLALLQEGVSPELAASRVDAIVRAQGGRDGLVGTAMSLRQPGPLDDHLGILMMAATLLLLVACVNVSNLLLQRAAARGSETAVRAALGAGRGRLFRQFILESLLLAVAGGVLGAAVAAGGLRLLLALRPEQLDMLRHVRIDRHVLLLCFGVSAVAGLLFGIVPALRAARVQATAALGRSGRGVLGGGARLRWSLVSAEIALSFALLVGATLLISTLRELSLRDPGFHAENLVSVEVRLPSWRHPAGDARAAAMDEVARALRGVPGVAGAVLSTSVPPRIGIARFGHLQVEGHERESTPSALLAVEAEPGFLEIAGLSPVSGRTLSSEDALTSADVVVITESAALRLFGTRAAVGRRFRIEGPPDLTVVGVVPDIRATGLTADPSVPLLYYARATPTAGMMTFAVRTSEPAARVLPELRRAVRNVEPEAVLEMATASELLHASIARERFTTTLLVAFATLALLLAAIGVFGVLSQVVTAHTREIGLRMALGADSLKISAHVLRAGTLAVAAGLAVGVVVANAGIQALQSEMFGLAETQPLAWVAAALVLLTSALCAMILPAWRAARMDPLRAIGTE